MLLQNIGIPIYLSVVSRLHGSAVALPKFVKGLLYSVPYAASVYITYGQSNAAYLFTFVTALWVMAFKNTSTEDGFQGEGRINPLSRMATPVALLFNIQRNSKAYDFIYWMFKGGLTSLLPALLIMNPWIFLTSLLGYALAYRIGYSFLPLAYATTCGELLGGLISGVGFLI